MNKSRLFDKSLQDLPKFAKALSHPARLQILKYIPENKTCITGEISSCLPLGRSTVTEHLNDLKKYGLIKGNAKGKEIRCSLRSTEIKKYLDEFNKFFEAIRKTGSTE